MIASFHNHSTWSDGQAPFGEFYAYAKKTGVEILGLSDHFCIYPDGTFDDRMLRRGWCFGSEEFRAALLDRLDGGAGRGSGMEWMHDERETERIVKEGLEAIGGKKINLAKTAKGSAEKVALASFIRKRTMMTNGWLSKNLHMGDPSRVSRYCCAAAGRTDIRKLVRKLEMSIGKA